MKKMIKLSLVAAVAVAGLTTTASAAPMADSIKNTDLSGYIRYRYTNGSAETETNAYKTVFVTKSKVNDAVTAKLKVAGEGKTSDASGDADPVTVAVKEANFVMNVAGATVIAGKQGLATPFADGGDQQGSGVVVVKPVNKSLTLAAGWYTNSDAKSFIGTKLSGNNIAALAAIGKAGSVNYAAWYVTISENMGAAAMAGATATNLNLSTKVANVSLELNVANVDYTGTTGDTLADQEQTRVVAATSVAGLNVAAGFVTTGTEGGNVTLGDTDAAANFSVENVSVSALADADATYLSVSKKFGKVTVTAETVSATGKVGQSTAAATAAQAEIDADENKFSVAYAMSKNFKISGFVTSGETGTTETDMSRIEVKYTF